VINEARWNIFVWSAAMAGEHSSLVAK